MTLTGKTLATLALSLARGETTSRALVETALEAIDADSRAFTHVDAAGARAAAAESDGAREEGRAPSLAGIPVSVKDLFDIKGQPTPAGSVILADAPPAAADAQVVSRLKRAGLVIIGRTQMSEFAYTGLGLNPHVPQPPNPRDGARVPGGSSGGAAVSVALGQAAAGLGTDTGGSVRIPAAFCGLVGFKPTQRRVSRSGCFPLSPSLDSIGPIANSVACCRTIDAVIADRPARRALPVTVAGLRLGIPEGLLIEDLEPTVSKAFDAALAALSAAGARIRTFAFPELNGIPAMNARGSLSNAEAYALHRRGGLLDERKRYDPDVLARIELAAGMSAADYLDIVEARSRLIAGANMRCAPFDAIIAPTTPIVAPLIEAVKDRAAFAEANRLALRNPMVVNLLDRCAVSLPVPGAGAVPVGLMIIGEAMGDARLLAIAEAVETALRR